MGGHVVTSSHAILEPVKENEFCLGPRDPASCSDILAAFVRCIVHGTAETFVGLSTWSVGTTQGEANSWTGGSQRTIVKSYLLLLPSG